MTQTMMPSPTPTAEANAELDRLIRQARLMWDREPALAHDDREAVICELIDVDLQLERIGLRALGTTLDTTSLAQLRDCSQRLRRLERHWVPEVLDL